MTQYNNEVASAPATCPKCDGEGVIHTGIGEYPTTLCNKCDGAGTVPAEAASASQSSTAGAAKDSE